MSHHQNSVGKVFLCICLLFGFSCIVAFSVWIIQTLYPDEPLRANWEFVQNAQSHLNVKTDMGESNFIEVNRLHDNEELVQSVFNGDIAKVKDLLSRGAEVNAISTSKYNYLLSTKTGITALHASILCDNSDIAKILLSYPGINVDIQDDDGDTPLIIASSRGNVGIVNIIVNLGANLNCINKDKETALHWAIQRVDREMITILIERGANINIQNNDGESPFMLLCQWSNSKENEKIFHMLMLIKLIFSLTNKNGNTAIHHAADSHNEVLLSWMCMQGVDLDIQNALGESPLHIGVLSKNYYGLEQMLKYGANAKVCSKRGLTPLDYAYLSKDGIAESTLLRFGAQAIESNKRSIDLINACKESNIDLVEELVAIRVKADFQDRYGKTALHYAAAGGNTTIINFVLKCPDADPNARDVMGETPVHLSNSVQVLDSLLNNGGRIAELRDDGRSLLHLSSERGLYDVAAKCISLGLDVGGFDNSQRNCVHVACDSELANDESTVTICRLIISAGGDPFAKDRKGVQPLHLAASRGKVQTISYLLDIRGDITVEDMWGSTPLHYAIENKEVAAAKLLLMRGAPFLKVDAWGRTCKDLARINGMEKIISEYMSDKK